MQAEIVCHQESWGRICYLLENSANGHIGHKNKAHGGVILQSGNSTVAFLWVLCGDSLVPEAHCLFSRALGSCSARRDPPWGQGCAAHSADHSHWSWPSRQSKCINQLQDLYCPSVNCVWGHSLPQNCLLAPVVREVMKILRFIKARQGWSFCTCWNGGLCCMLVHLRLCSFL